VTDNDVWWHLKTGEYICQNRAVPHTDPFSFTIAGKEWTSFEWLGDTVLYSVYRLVSIKGLTLFKALLVLVLFLILFRTVKEKESPLVWIILALAFLAMRDGLRERPQIFTYLLTAVYVFILDRGKEKTFVLLPFLQVLWVNIHGPAALIGVGLLGLHALFAKGGEKRFEICTALAVAAACFINPNGYKIFVYLYEFFSRGFNLLILEYRQPPLSVYYSVYYILLALCLVSLLIRGKTPAWKIAAVLLSAAGSAAAIRNIPVFAVIAAPAAAGSISAHLREHRANFQFKPDFLKAGALGFSFIVLFWFAGEKLDPYEKYRFGLGNAHRSRYAAEFLKWCSLRGFKGPIFNDYDFGGYLIWKLYPMQKVFIDGRLLEYGTDLVEKSFYFWKPEVWRELEGKYNFTAAVIPNENYYSCSFLDTRKDWVLVYWDDNALVYFKDIPQNKEFIAKYGYRTLKPNSPNQCYLKQEPVEKVLCELERSLYFSPGSRKAGWMKKYVCGD